MFYKNLFASLRQTSPLRLVLLNMALLDELLSGFLVIGLPLERAALRLSYEQIGLVFTIAGISSIVLEPVLSLLSDLGSKRWWIICGLPGLALSFAFAASVQGFVLLVLAVCCINIADGVAVGLSQATLIELSLNESTSTMARWTMFSSIGDLLAPLAVTTILAFGLGWSGLCWIAAACWLFVALMIWKQQFPPAPASLGQSEGISILLANVRAALCETALIRWAILSLLPDMLDEVFLAFEILYLRDVFHASPILIGFVVAAQMAGGFLGLLALDRLVHRFSPVRLLIAAALLTLAGVVVFLASHILWLTIAGCLILSLGASSLYPIAKAEAYRCQPGRSGTVRAIISLGKPYQILLPGIVGFLAGQFGLLAGLAFLGSAPLWILLLLPYKQ